MSIAMKELEREMHYKEMEEDSLFPVGASTLMKGVLSTQGILMLHRFNPALLILLILLCPLYGKAQDTSQQNSSEKAASKPAAADSASVKDKQGAQASGTGGKKATSSDDKQADPKDKFAFPEAISRKAAEAAARDANTPDAPGLSSSDNDAAGVSSSRSGDTGADDEDSGANGSDTSRSRSSSSLALKDAGSNADVRNPYRAADDDNVADFYYKNGNYMGAYMRYKDAIHYKPDDAKAHYGLAQLEQQFGQNDDAIQHYNEYLKLEPDGSKAKDARRAIKKLVEKASGNKDASKK